MDVLTEEELRVEVSQSTSRLPLYACAVVYVLVLCAAVIRHEPWADEAQSWLLARDASLGDLWTRLLHYEGTTGLWQTLLHSLIPLGLPYVGMSVIAALSGIAATFVLLRYAPFPMSMRIALPFTFFLCYQYAVIARSYSLLPLLLFGCAAIYPRVNERPAVFAVLLSLMAAVSVHGMALAAVVGMSALVSRQDRRRLVVPAVCFAAVAALLTASARPAPDGTFIAGLNFSFGHFVDVSSKALESAFTGEAITSLVMLGLSVPLLWRGGGWQFFLATSLMLCGIGSVVYSQVWHHGVWFLGWVFALWISWPASRGRPDLATRAAIVALSIVMAIQGYWTICSIGYDWRQPYSGSLAAAQGLRELDLAGKKLYAIGYANTAIQPYFPRNIFANVNEGRPEAYWDWSRRNHVNQDSVRLAESRPDYVMIGYKNEFERGVWTDLVRKSGYRAVRHFEGNTYWQTDVLEPESYDLYERGSSQ